MIGQARDPYVLCDNGKRGGKILVVEVAPVHDDVGLARSTLFLVFLYRVCYCTSCVSTSKASSLSSTPHIPHTTTWHLVRYKLSLFHGTRDSSTAAEKNTWCSQTTRPVLAQHEPPAARIGAKISI